MASADSWTLEITSPVAAPRLFRAAVLDWHTLAPKLASHVVASAHPVEGDGGVGSVRQFNFTSVMPFSFMNTLIEGGGICVATATSHIKLEPAADGGSVVKVESTSHIKVEPAADGGSLVKVESTYIEGGGIGVAIETATSHIKVEPADGGSVVKVETTFKPLPGVEVKDEITKAKESLTAIFKGAEAYLVANPDAYN